MLYNARYTILCDQATDLYRLYNYTLYIGQCVKLTFVPGGGGRVAGKFEDTSIKICGI